MRVNLLLGFSLRAILIASLHIRRKSSKREDSSSEATYLNWIAFVDLTLEYWHSLVKHPSTDKLTEPSYRNPFATYEIQRVQPPRRPPLHQRARVGSHGRQDGEGGNHRLCGQDAQRRSLRVSTEERPEIKTDGGPRDRRVNQGRLRAVFTTLWNGHRRER